MNDFLLGAIATASAVAGLIFLRFHRRTRDRFFLYFVASFWIEAAARWCISALHWADEDDGAMYALRIVAYGLILVAILDKNLPRREKR
ncbi:MAG TPA: DUF5985 family protein [Rhodanobacteraceae bacterium]|nr:DUF5985 family protein [Rhodanobacteraceae bacterium]